MSTIKVVLLRHGESEFNKLNLFCGWHDAPLSEKGVEDSVHIAAGGILKHKLEFDQVYTSALQRAKYSTDLILKELNCSYLPIKVDWRLNERHYGNLTGFNKQDMAKKYGEDQVQQWRRSYNITPPDILPDNPYYYSIKNNLSFSDIPPNKFPLSESMETTFYRVQPAWNDIKNEALSGKRILIVTHGTVVRALVKHIEGLSVEESAKVNIPNSVPCVYEFDSTTGQLIGGVTYLADEEYVKKAAAKVASISNK